MLTQSSALLPARITSIGPRSWLCWQPGKPSQAPTARWRAKSRIFTFSKRGPGLNRPGESYRNPSANVAACSCCVTANNMVRHAERAQSSRHTPYPAACSGGRFAPVQASLEILVRIQRLYYRKGMARERSPQREQYLAGGLFPSKEAAPEAAVDALRARYEQLPAGPCGAHGACRAGNCLSAGRSMS